MCGVSGCFGVFQEIVCYGFVTMRVCFMCVTILFVLSMGHLLFGLMRPWGAEYREVIR